MMKQYFTVRKCMMVIALLLSGAGCREIYVPDVESQPGVLVVEGLVTNLKERSYVKLSIASQYNSGSADSAVRNAFVIIVEDNLVNYSMKEINAGYYVLDPDEFIAKPGHTYRLQIITADGFVYKSTPQKMMPPAEIDSMYGNLMEKEYIYKDVYGKTVGKMEQVDQTFLDFSINSDTSLQFRFKSTLLLGYTWIDGSTHPYPSVVYVWKKWNPDNTIVMTGSDNEINVLSAKNYAVSYFPLNEYLYGLAPDEHMENWFLQVRQYTLTDEAYRYYNEVNEQLSSTGAIFDPIAAQINGNMSCSSNQNRLVLGFFEVSACVKTSRYIKPHSSFNKVDYYPTYDLDSIPDEGRIYQNAPFFWQFIK